MQITVLTYTPQAGLQVYEDLNSLQQCSPAAICWIDVQTDDIEDMRHIAAHFRLHELTLDDCFTPGHFPKIEDFGSYLFMVFRGLKSGAEVEEIWRHRLEPDTEEPSENTLDDENDEVYTRKIAIYLSERFLITFRRRDVPWLDASVRQATQIPEKTIAMGTDLLAYRILDVLVDRFARGVGFFERLIDEMEETAIDSPEQFSIAHVVTLKRDLTSMRQLMREQRGVITRLGNDADLIRENQRRYFRDIDDHALSIVKTLDKEIEGLLGLRDTYFGMVNARLGDTMRILAIITTVAAPLNIVVGLYGMNFDAIPLLHSRHGFWLVCAFMLMVTAMMLYYFRKKQWF